MADFDFAVRKETGFPWSLDCVGSTGRRDSIGKFSDEHTAMRVLSCLDVCHGIPTSTLAALEGGVKRLLEKLNHGLTEIFEDLDEDQAAKWSYLLAALDEVLYPKEQGDAQ